jgi:hypothetical protein
MKEQPIDGSEGYDLLRRAIVERDEQAWAESVARYRPLLAAWAVRASARARLNERSEDIADQAIARAWAALGPERFAAFPSLGALLAYLRVCVTAVVIDGARAQAAHERIAQRLEAGAPPSPEQIVLQRLSLAELWRLVSNFAETRQERAVLVESFVYDLPPRAILARHPELFADVAEVYAIKRRLLRQLQHNPELQRMCEEAHAA